LLPRPLAYTLSRTFETTPSNLAGVREHLATLDAEALAELDLCTQDDLLELGLALEEWQFPHVAIIQIQEIEGDQDDVKSVKSGLRSSALCGTGQTWLAGGRVRKRLRDRQGSNRGLCGKDAAQHPAQG
jgi:hypothetical protein